MMLHANMCCHFDPNPLQDKGTLFVKAQERMPKPRQLWLNGCAYKPADLVSTQVSSLLLEYINFLTVDYITL